jgi:hypothetical protein
MEVLLEEKKKQVHEIIDTIEDDNFLDQIIAMYELESVKVNRNPDMSITREQAELRMKKFINSLPWKE